MSSFQPIDGWKPGDCCLCGKKDIGRTLPDEKHPEGQFLVKCADCAGRAERAKAKLAAKRAKGAMGQKAVQHTETCAKIVADRKWLEAEMDGQHPEVVDVACNCGAVVAP